MAKMYGVNFTTTTPSSGIEYAFGRMLIEKKIVSGVEFGSNKPIGLCLVLGRYGTNKATLRKIAKKLAE